MEDAVRALALSAALLVIVSGAAKIRTPTPATRLLATLRLPRWSRTVTAVRSIGAAEIVIGCAHAALATRWTAVALAGAYLGFAAVVAAALAAGTQESCGCFGAGDAAPGRAHLAVTVLATAASVAVAIEPGRVGWDGSAGLLLAAQTVLVTWLAYLALTLLPELALVRRTVAEEA